MEGRPAAIVFGGSGGIGAAICTVLAREGWDVAITYGRNRQTAVEAAERLARSGALASVHAVDASDEASVRGVVAEAAERHEQVAAMVWSIGPTVPQPRVAEVSTPQWAHAMTVEAHAFVWAASAVVPLLRTSGGAIVAVSSAGIGRHPPGDILSIAPKAAIEASVRGIAREEGRFGIRANSVRVGVAEAGMFLRMQGEELDQTWIDAAKKNIPMRRFGSGEEVAEVVAFLCGERASYVTGQAIAVDGGYSI